MLFLCGALLFFVTGFLSNPLLVDSGGWHGLAETDASACKWGRPTWSRRSFDSDRRL